MWTPPLTRVGPLLRVDDDRGDRPPALCAAEPRVALDAAGRPRLRLLTWAERASGGPDAVRGGRLDLELDVAPRPEELATAGFDEADWTPLPLREPTVRIEGPGFDAVEVAAAGSMPTRVAATLDLPERSAGLIATAIEEVGARQIQVVWSGLLDVRLPPVEVVATADVATTRHLTERVGPGEHYRAIRSAVEATVRIEIRGGVDPEVETSLRELAIDTLTERALEGGELVFRVAAADVVAWPVRLAGSLGDLVAPELRADLVRTELLSVDEIAADHSIEVRAVGPFDGGLVRVDVEFEAATGTDVERVSLEGPEPRHIFPESRAGRWRRRVTAEGLPTSGWGPWTEHTGGSGLVLPAPVEPVLDIEVVAAALDFETRWRGVEVTLEHTPDSGGVPEGASLSLDRVRRSAMWTHRHGGLRGRVDADLVWRSRDGLVVRRRLEDVRGRVLSVRDPFEGELERVTVVPTGTGWHDVDRVMVDLRRTDGDLQHGVTLALGGLDEVAEWTTPAPSRSTAPIEWRRHAAFTDGRFESSDWVSAEPGIVAVPLMREARREVTVWPIHLEAEVTERIEVRVRSGEEEASATLRDRAPAALELPAGPWRAELVWWGRDGSEVRLDIEESDDDVLVIPRLPAP